MATPAPATIEMAVSLGSHPPSGGCEPSETGAAFQPVLTLPAVDRNTPSGGWAGPGPTAPADVVTGL